MTDTPIGRARMIEIDGIAAGIAVAEDGRFRFFSAQRPFDPLDRRMFRSLSQVTRAAQDRLRRSTRPSDPHPPRVVDQDPTSDLVLAIPGPFLLPA